MLDAAALTAEYKVEFGSTDDWTSQCREMTHAALYRLEETSLDETSSRRHIDYVSNAKVLAEIKLMASRGDIRYSAHAKGRMRTRRAAPADILNAIATATAAIDQADGTWKVDGGVDNDRDELTVIAAIEANLVIVTIY